MNDVDIADGCLYMRKDGSRGWKREGGRWVTAVIGGRPKGSLAHYLTDQIVRDMVLGGSNPHWEFIPAPEPS